MPENGDIEKVHGRHWCLAWDVRDHFVAQWIKSSLGRSTLPKRRPGVQYEDGPRDTTIGSFCFRLFFSRSCAKRRLKITEMKRMEADRVWRARQSDTNDTLFHGSDSLLNIAVPRALCVAVLCRADRAERQSIWSQFRV